MIWLANNNTVASRTQLSGQFAKSCFVIFSRLVNGTDPRTEEESWSKTAGGWYLPAARIFQDLSCHSLPTFVIFNAWLFKQGILCAWSPHYFWGLVGAPILFVYWSLTFSWYCALVFVTRHICNFYLFGHRPSHWKLCCSCFSKVANFWVSRGQ